MADRKPVVLNEDNDNLEVVQDGDALLEDKRAKLRGGVHIMDIVSSWSEDDDDIPFEEKKGLKIGTEVPTSMSTYYEVHTLAGGEQVYHLDNNNGGYAYGNINELSVRGDVADVGYFTLEGFRSDVDRTDPLDIATGTSVNLHAFSGAINIDAGDTAVTDNSQIMVSQSKLERGTINYMAGWNANVLFGTTGVKDVTITTAVMGQDLGGQIGRTGGSSVVTNLYGWRYKALDIRGVTITQHRAISIEETTADTFLGSIAVYMPNLPVTDPTEAGQLWNDSGTLKISSG